MAKRHFTQITAAVQDFFSIFGARVRDSRAPQQ
jgi:hypothetical protein